MKIYIETMGCQMNRLDSELAVSALLAAGHEMTDDAKLADAVIINTCSVRRHAEQKVYSRIGTVGQRKAHRPEVILVVMGCMAQREGAQLQRDYPQVDIVVAPGRLPELPDLLAAASAGRHTLALDPPRAADSDRAAMARLDAFDLGRDVHVTRTPFQAFVRVQRGCDKFCTYCIVPFVRGPETCRAPAQIVQEVRRLVEGGRTEITLLGQTVNSYRWADGGAKVRFSDLLAQVSAVAGLRRLRFVTSYPLDFGDDILQAMRDLPNVCRYIHVPAQSGSDAMLQAMNRKYTRRQYDDLIDRVRAIVPDVTLAGDFIVGFPGETDEDHEASGDLIRRCGYKNSFIFKYSPRPGTAAARLGDSVPATVKKQRNNDLLAIQNEVALLHHQAIVGQTVEVLVEGKSPRTNKQPVAPPPDHVQLVGRTGGDHIVVFDGPTTLVGQYVRIGITGATALTLFGGVE